MAKRADPVQRRISDAERDWHGKTVNSRDLPQEQGRRARWHELDGEDCAREVQSVVSSLAVTEGWRRYAAMRALRRVDARPLTAWGIPPIEMSDAGPVGIGEIRLRVAKAMIDTFIADVCGRQKPKPQFLTSGSDWQLRRRAKKLDKFVYGCFCSDQQPYHDTWEAMTACVRDALAWGCGALKVYAGTRNITCERVFSYDLYTDPQESRNGKPQNLFQLVPYNREVLALEYPDHANAIMAAARWAEPEAWYLDSTTSISGARTSDIIRVVEAWYLPQYVRIDGEVQLVEGRHVITAGGALLYDEPWTRDRFPFAIIRWSPDPCGYWGTGVVDEIAELESEVNEHLGRMQERHRLLGGRRVYYPEGAISQENLSANDAETHIPVRPIEGGFAPIVEKVDPLNESDIAYLNLMRNLPFELCGISIQSASARKEPGVNSGAAMRTLADVYSARQAEKARRIWEMFAVDVGRLIVDAASDMAAVDPEFTVSWQGKSFLKEIPWRDVDLSSERFMVQVAPASSLPQDPGGRLEMAQDLFRSGLIGPAVFKRLLDWPDLEAEQARDSAEYEYVESIIDRYLDATESEIADPEFYEAPEGFFSDLLDVLAHCAQAYFIAKREGAPSLNLAILRRYIEDVQALNERKTKEAAAMAPNAAPPPSLAGLTGGPTPGAPPGAPHAPMPPMQ